MKHSTPQHCWTHNGQFKKKEIKINAAEPELSSILFHAFFFVVRTWRIPYPQYNLTSVSSVVDPVHLEFLLIDLIFKLLIVWAVKFRLEKLNKKVFKLKTSICASNLCLSKYFSAFDIRGGLSRQKHRHNFRPKWLPILKCATWYTSPPSVSWLHIWHINTPVNKWTN